MLQSQEPKNQILLTGSVERFASFPDTLRLDNKYYTSSLQFLKAINDNTIIYEGFDGVIWCLDSAADIPSSWSGSIVVLVDFTGTLETLKPQDADLNWIDATEPDWFEQLSQVLECHRWRVCELKGDRAGSLHSMNLQGLEMMEEFENGDEDGPEAERLDQFEETLFSMRRIRGFSINLT